MMKKVCIVIPAPGNSKSGSMALASAYGMRKKRLFESWKKYYSSIVHEIFKKYRSSGPTQMSVVFDERATCVETYIEDFKG